MALTQTAYRDAEVLPAGPDAPAGDVAFRWLARPCELLDECAATYGPSFTLRFARFGTHVVVSDPADVRDVFAAERDALSAGRGNVLLAPILGPHSLLLLDGEAHARERASLLPAFRAERLERLGALAAEAAHRHTATWGDGAVVSLQETALAIAKDVILRLVMGDDGEEIGPLVNDVMAVVATNATLDDRTDASEPARRFRLAHETLHAALQGVIDRRRRAPCDGGNVLDLLITADRDDAAIRDELVTFVLAGHETTAATLCWALVLLAEAPAALATLRAELAAHADVPDDRLAGLPHLQATCLETLRLRPAVPVMSREVLRPLPLGERILPPGVFVTPAAYLAHRLPVSFTDPLAFRPERFLAERFAPHEYFPFGGGARRCLGMGVAVSELQVVLGAIVRRFHLAPAGSQPVRPVRRAVTLVPSGGCRMRVVHRPLR
jgi:cytochrome P450